MCTWGEHATVAAKRSVGKRAGLHVAYCRRSKHSSWPCGRLGFMRQVKELVTLSSVPVHGTSVLYARRVEEVVAARSDCGEPRRDANGVRADGVFVRRIVFVVRTMIIAIVAATDVLLSRLHAVREANAAPFVHRTCRYCACVYVCLHASVAVPAPATRPLVTGHTALL